MFPNRPLHIALLIVLTLLFLVAQLFVTSPFLFAIFTTQHANPIEYISCNKSEASVSFKTEAPSLFNTSTHSEDFWMCNTTCCRSNNFVNDYFNGQPDQRPQFRDILSPLDFKLIADVHLGSIPNPDEYNGQLIKLNLHIIPCLQDGAVIFVDPWQIDDFVNDMLPLIHVRFVLMSGDSDDSNPKPDAWKKLSQDARLIHWFMQNYNLPSSDPHSDLATPLIYGNSHWNRQKENLIKVLDQDYGLKRGIMFDRDKKNSYGKWIFASFSVESNREARQPIWDMVSVLITSITTPICLKFISHGSFMFQCRFS
jgi:hypothetical protein